MTKAEIGALGAGLGLAGTSGVSQQADFIRASRDKGIDVSANQELLGELAGLGIGLTEMLPIMGMFRFIRPADPLGKAIKELGKNAEHSLLKKLKAYGKIGVGEAIQETAAGIGQEAVAKGLYDPNIPIGGSAYDDAVVGGTVGFLGGMLFDAILPGRQRNAFDIRSNEQKAKDQQSQQNFVDMEPEKMSFNIVPIKGESVEDKGQYNIVEKNTGIIVVPKVKGLDGAQDQLDRLNHNKNESVLISTMKSNIKEQGRNGDATSQTAILQANGDYSRNINQGIVLSTLFPKTSRKSSKTIWDKHIDKKFKGKTKKAKEKRNYYKNTKQFSPEQLLQDHVINKKQYNEIVNQKADVIAETSKTKLGTSAPTINKEFKNKNIDEKVGTKLNPHGSKNLQNYFFNLVGQKHWNKMTSAQKKYVLARIQQLPASPTKKKMVDVTPRKYTEKQFNDVIQLQDSIYEKTGKNKGYNRKEISALATGKAKPLSKEAEEQLIDRLLDSGRITREKGKYVFFKNRGKKNAITNESQFQKSVALNSQSYYETANEFRSRLVELKDDKGNRLLNMKEINQIVRNDNALKRKLIGLSEGEILQEDRLYRKESGRENEGVTLNVRERLAQYGLSAPEGMSPNKLKDMERVGKFVQEELKKRGIPEINIIAGSIFLKPNVESVRDLTASNAAYVSGVETLILNYDQLLNQFNPKDRNNLRNISDTVIGNRIGQTVNHEVFHAFTSMGLYSQDEWNSFKRFVKNTVTQDPQYKEGLKIDINGNVTSKKSEIYRVIDNPTYFQVAQVVYKEGSPELQYEEAMAEAFGFFTKNPNTFSGKPKNLLTKALDYLIGIFKGWNASGLNPSAIFELSMSGNLITDERLKQHLESTEKDGVKNSLDEEIKYQRIPLNDEEQSMANRILTIVDDANYGQGEARTEGVRLLEEAYNNPKINTQRLFESDTQIKHFGNAFLPYIQIPTQQNIFKKTPSEENIDRQRENFRRRQALKREGRKPTERRKPQVNIREGASTVSSPEGRAPLSVEEQRLREEALRRSLEEEINYQRVPDANNFALLDNGMPYSEAPYEFQISFADLTSEEIDNLTFDDFNEIAKRISDITGEDFKFDKDNFRTVGELKKMIQDAINSGEVDLDWYLKIGQQASEIVGEQNMLEFSVLWAITSAGTSPEINFRNAIQIMSLARGIDPYTGKRINKNVYEDPKAFKKNINDRKSVKDIKKSGVQFADYIPTASKRTVDEIIKFYEEGNWTTKGPTTIKTPIFALTTLMAKDAEYMPFMVADRWMYRVLGFNNKVLNGDKPKRSEMTYTQWMVKELSNETYSFDGKQYPLNPHEIQALLWFGVRNTSEESTEGGDVSSIVNEAQELKNVVKFAKDSKEWNDEESFVKQENFDLNPYELISFNGRGNFGTSQTPRILEYQKNKGSQLLIEVNPGVARGYGVITNEKGENVSLRQEQLIEMTDRIWNEISDSNGKINILKEYGIPHNVTRSYGGYNGTTTPNFVVDILGHGIDSALIEDVAITLADALMQDAVITIQPDINGDKANVLINKIPENGKDGVFTPDEIQLINDAINEDGGIPNFYDPQKRDPHGLTAKYTGNGILIADEMFFDDNFKNESDDVKLRRYKEFEDNIREKLSKIDELPELDYGLVTSKGDIIGYENYKGRAQGIGYKRSTSGSSDIQTTALDKLYLPAWRAFKNYLQENNLTSQNNTAPYESVEYTALPKALTANEVKMQKVVDTLDFMNNDLAGDMLPIFDMQNSSPLAQEAAYDWIVNESKAGIDPYENVDPNIDAIWIDEDIRYQKTPGAFQDLSRVDPKKLSIGQQALQTLTTYHGAFRTAVLDRYAALEKSSASWADVVEINMSAAYTAIGAARLGERMKGMMQQALTEGGIIYYTTGTALEGGTKVIQKYFTDRNGRTQQVHLLRAFTSINSKAAQELFQQYGVAKRIEGLTSDERKNNPFVKRLKDENLKLYNKIMEEEGVEGFIENIERNKPKVADAWEQFQHWNDGVIEYAKDAGILNNNTAQDWRNNANYFPFYREFDNIEDSVIRFFGEDMTGNEQPKRKKGVARLDDSVLTRELDTTIPLKNLEAPFSAILRNSLAIMQVSAKNITRQRLAREQREIFGDDPEKGVQDLTAKQVEGLDSEQYNSVFMYKVNGEKRFMKVPDPTIIKAIESYGSDQSLTGFLKIIGVPSTVLRELVTRDPGFMLINLMRDTLSVYTTSGADFTPIIDSIKGWVDPLENINRYGLVSGYDLANDKLGIEEFVNKELRNAERNTATGGKKLKEFFRPMGVWDRLGNWTTRSDASTRQAVYKRVLEATGDEFESAFQALEVINFNRRGSSNIVRVVTTAIPFLNARMQGMDVLWRSAATNVNVWKGKGQGARRYGAYQSLYGKESDVINTKKIGRNFFMRVGLLSAVTALYWLMVSDDEEYKNLKREVRDDNFVIPITKNFSLKYPIAFEVGVLTKTIPERMMDLMWGDATTHDTKESLMRQVRTTLKLDPLNWQIIAPFYEAMNNKNKYTGRPIVGHYQEGLDTEAQYEHYTNELARWLGNMAGVSPMKVDHMMKGYLGTLGGYGLMLTDKMARVMSGRNQSPFGLDNAPVVRRIFMDRRTSRGLQQRYYELKDAVDSVVNTERNLRKSKRDFKAAKIFRYNNQDIWSVKNEMNAITRYMNRFRKKRNRILGDETMPYKERVERIKELEAERDRRLMVIPLLQERANL